MIVNRISSGLHKPSSFGWRKELPEDRARVDFAWNVPASMIHQIYKVALYSTPFRNRGIT